MRIRGSLFVPVISLFRVWFPALLASAESLILRISLRKRIFQQNHFSLFSKGLGGLVSLKKNAKKSRDTDTLKPNCDINFSKSKNWFINMSYSRYYVTLHKSHPCPILTSAHLEVHSELWGNSAEYWNRNRELVFIDKNILWILLQWSSYIHYTLYSIYHIYWILMQSAVTAMHYLNIKWFFFLIQI